MSSIEIFYKELFQSDPSFVIRIHIRLAASPYLLFPLQHYIYLYVTPTYTLYLFVHYIYLCIILIFLFLRISCICAIPIHALLFASQSFMRHLFMRCTYLSITHIHASLLLIHRTHLCVALIDVLHLSIRCTYLFVALISCIILIQ